MEDFVFSMTSNCLILEKYTGVKAVVVVPNTFNGKPVTTIGTQSFSRSDLVEVHFPSNVEKINSNAFEFCSNLRKVSHDCSNLHCHKNAFGNCDSLEDVPFDMWRKLNFFFSQMENLMKRLSIRWEQLTLEEKQGYINFLKRRKVWQRHFFTNCEHELMHFLLAEVISPSLEDLNFYLEMSIKNNNTTVTALLLDYKNGMSTLFCTIFSRNFTLHNRKEAHTPNCHGDA